MIQKQDCISLLSKIEAEQHINVNKYLQQLLLADDIPLEILQFIIKQQGLEVTNFYEMLRHNYNNKKSKLYINLVQEEPKQNIIITLSCLLNQIVLFGNKLTQSDLFFKQIRAAEISRAINDYFETGSYELCIKMLNLIRNDLIVLEAVAGRRKLN